MGRENKGHEERCRKAGQGEAKLVCVCVHTHTCITSKYLLHVLDQVQKAENKADGSLPT